MATVTTALLRRLPKAELHCHLDGSLRPTTLWTLGQEYGIDLPAPDADALGEYMVVRGSATLEAYLERFAVTLSVMQRAEALEQIAYELAEDAAADGVRYIEVRYAPVLNVRGGLSLDEAVEAPLRGLARAERDHGIVARVIICGIRSMPPTTSLERDRLAVSVQDGGVVAFDLAGGERGNPDAAHAEAFAYVRGHDMACTCHAGEGDGPASVRQALHVCGAHRVGHATRMIEDASLTQYANDRRIPLEICLTSNVQTGAAASYEQHPLRRYYDQGLVVVLSTDNRLMSGTTLTDEYRLAARHLDFDFAELSAIAVAGFESAFLPRQERAVLVARIRGEIAQLGAAVR
ncbi:MAG: adenosine deaminase [Gemmatimonadaceae bacterium]